LDWKVSNYHLTGNHQERGDAIQNQF